MAPSPNDWLFPDDFPPLSNKLWKPPEVSSPLPPPPADEFFVSPSWVRMWQWVRHKKSGVVAVINHMTGMTVEATDYRSRETFNYGRGVFAEDWEPCRRPADSFGPPPPRRRPRTAWRRLLDDDAFE